jgi:SET domain-containing protein
MAPAKLEVRDAGPKGRGVFALRPIARGELVASFTGWTLATAELTDDLFALQIGHDLWLCSHGDHLDDCINHSCDPNTGFVTGQTVLFALRDIARGEEITFDYATSIGEAGWSLECACASPLCRKIVVSWGEMPAADRDRMREVALSYLRTWR